MVKPSQRPDSASENRAMIDSSTKTIYTLMLDNPANPGYVSGDKPYFGSKEEIIVAASLMRCREAYGDTVAAIDDYFCGNNAATHRVAFQTMPVLTTTDLISECKLAIPEKEWEHTNTWGFPYIMKCEKAFIHQIIVKHEDKYCRCLRVWFYNLRYKTPGSEWNKITSWWGHRDLMLNYHLPGGGFKLNNVLYLLDKQYDTVEGAIDSLTNPDELSFSSFCDEIFADG